MTADSREIDRKKKKESVSPVSMLVLSECCKQVAVLGIPSGDSAVTSNFDGKTTKERRHHGTSAHHGLPRTVVYGDRVPVLLGKTPAFAAYI